jgi:hypothetical protein
VSYFDVMDDATLARFQARGLGSRSDAVISRAARDSQPLASSGERFLGTGALENWIPLQ